MATYWVLPWLHSMLSSTPLHLISKQPEPETPDFFSNWVLICCLQKSFFCQLAGEGKWREAGAGGWSSKETWWMVLALTGHFCCRQWGGEVSFRAQAVYIEQRGDLFHTRWLIYSKHIVSFAILIARVLWRFPTQKKGSQNKLLCYEESGIRWAPHRRSFQKAGLIFLSSVPLITSLEPVLCRPLKGWNIHVW